MKDGHRSQAQDWVCLNCSNLNYSFRKICNRCKITTREDNQKYQQLQYYNIYYQNQYYQTPTACYREDRTYPAQHEQEKHQWEDIGTNEHAQIRRKGSESGSVGRSPGGRWETEDEIFVLLPNAWQDLKAQEPLCSSSESSAEQLSEEWQQQEMFLPNFDLTFL